MSLAHKQRADEIIRHCRAQMGLAFTDRDEHLVRTLLDTLLPLITTPPPTTTEPPEPEE
jgi:hypothetical protein